MDTRLIDSHAHLTPRFFGERLSAVVEESLASLAAVVVIGAGGGANAARDAAALATRHARIFSTAGVHPHDARHFSPVAEAFIREIAREAKTVAFGEMGLDYFYDRSPRDLQRGAFRAQLRLAREFRMPVVLHIRDAWPDALAILRDELLREAGGVVHCFTGGPREAEEVLGLGLALGVSGIATYDHAAELRDVFATAPYDRLLVETDSPYLSPEPYRRERPNRPALVQHVAEALATWRGTALEEIARQTTHNAHRIFRLPELETLR